MIIKRACGQSQEVAALQELLTRPDITSKTRTDIERDIRNIRAGEVGEREATYEIDFHHGLSRNWAVIHDLRLEHEGRVAQIDHLLIGRFLDIWVCETKHFGQGVSINEQGEFTSFYNGRPQAIPSPIEQNRKHISVLEKLLRSDKVMLPTRLGITLRPELHSVILISQKARISRPKSKSEGVDMIVKSDQFRALIERKIDEESVASSLMTIGKLISSESLENFASQVARLHRPLRRDWAATFALKPERDLPSASQPDRLLASSTDEADQLSDRRMAMPSRSEDVDLLTTSKLGAAMGLPNVDATLKHLTEAGLLEMDDGKPKLTEEGRRLGGKFVEKGRFGPYFLWPKDLMCSPCSPLKGRT